MQTWLLVLVSLILLGAPGCCSSPAAERYFDRQIPFNTINGFVYAVETGQWDFVYDCLSSKSQEHFDFSPFRVRAAISWAEEPSTKIPVYDLIVNAERNRRFVEEIGGGESIVTLLYDGKDSEGKGAFFVIRVFLVPELRGDSEPLWLIDLERTIREMSGGAEPEITGVPR